MLNDPNLRLTPQWLEHWEVTLDPENLGQARENFCQCSGHESWQQVLAYVRCVIHAGENVYFVVLALPSDNKWIVMETHTCFPVRYDFSWTDDVQEVYLGSLRQAIEEAHALASEYEDGDVDYGFEDIVVVL